VELSRDDHKIDSKISPIYTSSSFLLSLEFELIGLALFFHLDFPACVHHGLACWCTGGHGPFHLGVLIFGHSSCDLVIFLSTISEDSLVNPFISEWLYLMGGTIQNRLGWKT
jgi:hypothetical protein